MSDYESLHLRPGQPQTWCGGRFDRAQPPADDDSVLSGAIYASLIPRREPRWSPVPGATQNQTICMFQSPQTDALWKPALAPRVLAVGDGRTGVTGPQPDHLVRYRDEARSGSNADDDIGGENGYGHTDDDPDAGQHGDQPPVPGA